MKTLSQFIIESEIETLNEGLLSKLKGWFKSLFKDQASLNKKSIEVDVKNIKGPEDSAPLKDIEAPYNLGFNTTGLWGYMRHPNYLGEQGIWVSLYLLVMASGYSTYIFSWSLIGPLLLILLFMGSSTLAEGISSSKYPKYKDYQEQVFKYLPIKKYKND